MYRSVSVLLTLGLSASALAGWQPPTGAPDIRNAYASLNAVPGVPEALKVDFADAEVLLRSITVEPTSVPASGSCRVLVRINNQLAKVLIVEPPSNDVGIDQPPGASATQTWQALLEPFGIDQPPVGIVVTPEDSVLVTLESLSSNAKDEGCSVNVLALGSVVTDDLIGKITPIDPDDLRSEFFGLEASPDEPGEYEQIGMDDVLVSSYEVTPNRRSEVGKCLISVRINGLLASILVVEPPGTIVRRDEPPSGIVFSPNDSLKIELKSLPTGKAADKDKDKDKNDTCSADVLLLGTKISNDE